MTRVKPSKSPPRGGVVVQVQFRASQVPVHANCTAICRFGAINVPARLTSNSSATCLSPPMPPVGAVEAGASVVGVVPFALSLDGSSFDFFDAHFVYERTAVAPVRLLSPSRSSSGTTDVTATAPSRSWLSQPRSPFQAAIKCPPTAPPPHVAAKPSQRPCVMADFSVR